MRQPSAAQEGFPPDLRYKAEAHSWECKNPAQKQFPVQFLPDQSADHCCLIQFPALNPVDFAETSDEEIRLLCFSDPASG